MNRRAAEELKEIIEHLVTLGNTKLTGTYIFGGKRANEAPFRLNKDYSIEKVYRRADDFVGRLRQVGPIEGRQP